jgi:hypothetical protein
MKLIGMIGSEGGPLLIIDAESAHQWKGIDSNDYDRACDLFDMNINSQGMEIKIENTHGLLWEMDGPGVAYIFSDDFGIYIIRVWINGDAKEYDAALDSAKQALSLESTHIGEMTVNSKKLAIMWAPENGEIIKSALELGMERDNKKSSIDDSSILFDVKKYIYNGYCDVVENQYSKARRLFLI